MRTHEDFTDPDRPQPTTKTVPPFSGAPTEVTPPVSEVAQEPASEQLPPLAFDPEELEEAVKPASDGADDAPQPKQGPEPEPVAVVDPPEGPVGRWAWLTPTRITIGFAAIPSLISLIWLVTSVAEIISGPEGEMTAGGIATGVFFDVLVVGTLVFGWFFPSVRQLASIGGWIGAGAASALLTYHYWGTEAVAFAVVPLFAKFLWQLALQAKTAAEKVKADRALGEAQRAQDEQKKAAEEASADDSSLTVKQRKIIAAELNGAEFDEALAAARARRARAEIEADNTVRMARDEAEAARLRERFRLAGEIGGMMPLAMLAQYLPDLPGVNVTEVQQGQLGASPQQMAPAAAAGSWGSVNAQAAPVAGFGFSQPTPPAGGAPRVDLGVPPHASPAAPPAPPQGASPAPAPSPAQAVESTGPQRLLAYMEWAAKAGEGTTVKGASRELDVDPKTIRRYRDKLTRMGYDMSALGGDN